MFALDDIEPADARSNVNSHPLRNLGRYFQARGLHRLVRRRQGQMDEAAHLLQFFLLDEIQRIEFFTSAAIWQANSGASNWVMRATPLLPASSFFHTSSAVFPTPQIRPIPVITTLRPNYFPPFPCFPM